MIYTLSNKNCDLINIFLNAKFLCPNFLGVFSNFQQIKAFGGVFAAPARAGFN